MGRNRNDAATQIPRKRGRDRFADPGPQWAAIAAGGNATFDWDEHSLFFRRPPFFTATSRSLAPILGARPLLVLGDDVTTDHISPGGTIPPTSQAGRYLAAHGVPADRFGTYIGRRANHEVMIRGTFASLRILNEMIPGWEGGVTHHFPGGEVMTVFEAAERYRAENCPLIVIAGRNYGCGSSRDWAAKGTSLLGARAVIAESFERIHRSNLVGMGVLPLQFLPEQSRHMLTLSGQEIFDIADITAALVPGARLVVRVTRPDGSSETFEVISRVDAKQEANWIRSGGILPYVLHALQQENIAAP